MTEPPALGGQDAEDGRVGRDLYRAGEPEVVAERYLREQGVLEMCQLVGVHVMVKRSWTVVDKEYYNGLSDASQKTLKMQVSMLLCVGWVKI